jgi:hypothetical protein
MAKEKQRIASKEKESRRTADVDGRGAEEQLTSECELSYQLWCRVPRRMDNNNSFGE